MILDKLPEDFKPRFQVAACILEADGKLLLVLRNDEPRHRNTWAFPGGGIDAGELPEQAMARELWEETGIKLDQPKFTLFKPYHIRYPNEIDFILVIFSAKIDHVIQSIKLRPVEHLDYKWVTPQEGLKLNLLIHADQIIKDYYGITS